MPGISIGVEALGCFDVGLFWLSAIISAAIATVPDG